MNGWCKFTFEDEKKVTIKYSLEENRNCDGELSFDKATREIQILKLSESATADLTNHFICVIRGRMRRGFELNKVYYLAVG